MWQTLKYTKNLAITTYIILFFYFEAVSNLLSRLELQKFSFCQGTTHVLFHSTKSMSSSNLYDYPRAIFGIC